MDGSAAMEGGGGYGDLIVGGRAVWLLARVWFLRTFVVFLCKKTEKLLATKSSDVTRYVVRYQNNQTHNISMHIE